MGSLLTRLLWLCSAAGAVQLTERSWQQVAGKTVFVNFHAQWCSHCQALKPTWNKLANAQFRFQDARKEKAILIADVDCSGDAAKFCVDMGVDKFPTLKHGHPLDLDEYKGKKELRDLERFLQELQPVCTVEEQSFCSAAEKKLIKKFQKTSVPALEEVIEELAAEKRKVEAEYSLFKDNLLGTLTKAGQQKDKDVSAAPGQEKAKIEEDFRKFVDGLTAQHDAKEAETKAALTKLKRRGLALARSVQANRKPRSDL
ncbi:unnamed protein product [Effrenium voratum]|nr:unnamed protein product [Effrenium voratum]CAJ1418575.1 unnamed protein product [Effrenium voratum]